MKFNMGNWIKRNFYLFLFGIFAIIGSIMGIVAAVVWLNSVALQNNGVHTVGTVIDMIRDDGTQAPVVRFSLGNGTMHTYTSSMYSNPPAYDIGENVELWYDPANPDAVSMSGMDSWFIPVFLGAFFLIFGGVGYGGLLYQYFKKRNIADLQMSGQAIAATFIGINLNTNVRMNGASPYVIQCQWQDSLTNKVHVFTSDDIWFDPTKYIKGETLRVLIEPENPGNYYVDISFLPEV